MNAHAPAPGSSQTLPGLLLERALVKPRDVAFREKDGGIWRATSWSDYRNRVEGIAFGLAAMGIGRGDAVGIMGDNRPEWVCCELAAQAIGAIPLGVYQDATSEELESLVDAGRVGLLVVEDQEQVDKVLAIRSRRGRVSFSLVYWDPRGLVSYRKRGFELKSLSEVIRVGEKLRDREPNLIESRVASLTPEDTALYATTSGTTGTPKLAMLSHHNLLSMANNLALVDPIGSDDELVSFLPLPWVGEQMMAVANSLARGARVNFPEEPETATRDLREIAPTVTFAPPRIWEGLLSEVEMKHEDASATKKLLLRWALRVGAETSRQSNGSLPPIDRLRRRLADACGLFWLRDALGLHRLRRAYTGGAPLGPDVLRFFHSIGVNLKQIYGQTEIAGIAVAHRDGDVTAESVGVAIPGTSIRIAESGEILLRSHAVFSGYLGNEEATKRALQDGWLHTGDAGYLDARGHLVVVDRASDVSKLLDGTSFSPQFVENRLKFSPHVREAVVFGGGSRPFVAAIVVIDFDNVALWAERRSISFSTFTDLSQRPEVIDLLSEHVASTNAVLPRAMRVRRFLLLHKELDADDQELTRTRKVRRGFVEQRYRELVHALYGDGDAAEVDSEVVYQDGRTAMVSERLRLVTLPVQGARTA